jgi:hypothetical protein
VSPAIAQLTTVLARAAAHSEVFSQATTAFAIAAIVAAKENQQTISALSQMSPGETAYAKDIYATFLSGLLMEDVYLEITIDTHGNPQYRYVSNHGI